MNVQVLLRKTATGLMVVEGRQRLFEALQRSNDVSLEDPKFGEFSVIKIHLMALELEQHGVRWSCEGMNEGFLYPGALAGHYF